MLGNLIDGLDDEARDRIVRETCWQTGRFASNEGRCLIGVIVDMKPGTWYNACAELTQENMLASNRLLDKGVHRRFDALCERFGMDRIVRAIKLRAGATLDDLPQPEREAAGASR